MPRMVFTASFTSCFMCAAFARIISSRDGFFKLKTAFPESIFLIFTDCPGFFKSLLSRYDTPKPFRFLAMIRIVSPFLISSEHSMTSLPSIVFPLRCPPFDEILTSFFRIPESMSARAPSIIRSSLKAISSMSNLRIPKRRPSTIISSVLSSPGILFRRMSFPERGLTPNECKTSSLIILSSCGDAKRTSPGCVSSMRAPFSWHIPHSSSSSGTLQLWHQKMMFCSISKCFVSFIG
ncbi:Uncharacterised protein [uncultured archaeon]|nr:Uncharacterised protein [uncultured archaeon]